MSGFIGKSGRYRTAARSDDRSGVRSLPEQRVTVLLVDSRAWTREALARALETACRVLRFGDASDLAQADAQGGAMVVLLSVPGISLADSRVFTAIAIARSCLPEVPVVVLSDSTDANEILSAIERGLRGYITISLELRMVIDALRFVAAGGTFVPAEPLLANLSSAPPPSPPKPMVGDAAAAALVNNEAAVKSVLQTLSPREIAVLDWLRQGKSNKQIARELAMSEATVKVHVRHIMRKMGAVNRTQVAMFADGLA